MTEEGFDLIGEALKSAGLLVDDPQSQTGVVERVSSGARVLRIENVYRFAQGVRCSICPHRQMHQQGITLRLEDGALALCGRDCCNTRWGPGTYEQLADELQQRERGAIYRIRVKPLLQHIERALALTSGWLKMAQVSADFRKAFETTFPNLFHSLKEAGQQHNSQLFVEQESVNPVTGRRSRDRVVRTLYRGYAFLQQNPFRPLSEGRTGLARAKRLLEESPHKNEEFKVILELCRNARSNLLKASHAHNAACNFCDAHNIQAVVQWTKEASPDGAKYIFQKKDRRLLRRHDLDIVYRGPGRLVLPTLVRICDADEVDRLLQT